MAGLYIHIPFCKSKCAYCGFPSFAGREGQAGRYFSAMLREAELWREKNPFAGGRSGPPLQVSCQFAEGRLARCGNPFPAKPHDAAYKPHMGGSIEGGSPPSNQGEGVGGEGSKRGDFDTVFIGGGTPSLLPAGFLERFIGGLRPLFDIHPVEFTVEANPGTVDREKLASFLRMGANRISLGLQAAQDSLLKRIGRIHTWADFVRSYELAREAGFTNVNADMMTGLPSQTPAQAMDTARKLAALGLEHVSCYGLMLEEGTPLFQAVENGGEAPPDDDEEREMFHAARAVLEDAGYRRYEISNFSKPGMECLHNLNCWHNGNYLGLGLGAASHFPLWRRENRSDLDEYMAACESGIMPPADEHEIGPDEAAFETIMLELRLTEGIDFKRFEARHRFGFLSKYGRQVEKLGADGLMKTTPAGVALTERGMDLQNTALMEFME